MAGSIEDRKAALTNFIMKVFEEYSDNTSPDGEVYFTFIKHEGKIVANVCKENNEVESFILTIEPSNKRFVFRKPE